MDNNFEFARHVSIDHRSSSAHPQCKNLQHSPGTQNKENKEVNTIDPNPGNSYRTEKNFTGFYTEENPHLHLQVFVTVRIWIYVNITIWTYANALQNYFWSRHSNRSSSWAWSTVEIKFNLKYTLFNLLFNKAVWFWLHDTRWNPLYLSFYTISWWVLVIALWIFS